MKFNSWVSDDIRNKKRKIVELEEVYRKTKAENLKLQIQNLKQDVKVQSNNDKKSFFDNKILNSKNKSRTTWRLIKSEFNNLQNKSDNINVLAGTKIISNPKHVGNVLNDFFINAVDNLILPNIHEHVNNITPEQNFIKISDNFRFKEISEDELYRLVMAFENKFSTGIDGIPISVVKQCIFLILKPLTHIVNSSLISGLFPPRLKIAKVVPIFKKGNSNDPSSYRPVSLLPVCSKILEKVVYNQLLDFLECNKLLDNEQHGFRQGKSTISAGINFIESIIDSVDKNENIVGIFLDLTKAFDSVSHDKLLKQLTSLNIKGKELNWFNSYLKNRMQCVELHNTINCQNSKYKYTQTFYSDFQIIKHGVPQGSILGPLLFICYITGLPDVIPRGNGSICLYADDTNITIRGDNQEAIELISFISLLSVKEFLDKNNLLLNTSKSNFISFSTKQNRSKLQPNISINNSIIDQVDVTKFVGLIIDQNLSWDKHVDYVVKKCCLVFMLYVRCQKYVIKKH